MQLEAFPGQKRRGISLTPLIDVVFILLLFFMLTSSFIQWQSLDLTMSTGEGSEVSGEPPLMLGMAPDGRPILPDEPLVFLDDRQLSDLLAGGDRTVILTPPPASSIQQVVWLLDKVGGLGAASVSVNTGAAE